MQNKLDELNAAILKMTAERDALAAKQIQDNQQKLERLIPRAKVAFILGVCNRTVKRMEAKKVLTPHVINTRLTAYPESQVMLLISTAKTAGQQFAAS